MVLSSNWIALQNSEKVGPKTSRKISKNKLRRDQNQNGISGNKFTIKPSRKSSKIMDMVYSMNDEIEKAEQNKKEGKKFEFKVREPPSITDKLTNEVSQTPESLTHDKVKSIGKYVAMDCEFVGVGPEGKESALARVSLVNYYGHVILDEFVKPREKVTDWRTWVSGIRPEHMKEAVPFKQAQESASEILKGRILVGHSLKHDLESLLISHPKSMTRDTSRHLPFRQAYAKGKTPSLKKLAKEVLKQEIQGGQHSSVEDAKITMLLYKSERREFERLHQATFGFPK